MRILKIGLVVLSLLLAGICAFLQHTFPTVTGYTAHYLCLQAFYSHRNLDEVFKREILPIHPLFKYVTFEKDPSLPLIRASGFGVFGKSEAYFNKDIGCTVLTSSSPQRLTEMFAQLPPVEKTSPSLPWPKGNGAPVGSVVNDKLARVIAAALQEPSSISLRNTHAIVVVQDGVIAGEGYGNGIEPATPLLGWSMTKGITGLLTGLILQEKGLARNQANLFSHWGIMSGPKSEITFEHLLQWRSGLGFIEDYGPDGDTPTMLYREQDMAAYVLGKPMIDLVGARHRYESGSSVLLAKVLARLISDKPADFIGFARKRLFSKIGVDSAILEVDNAGTFVASSYMLANARDWARIGLLFLNNGKWEGSQLIPMEWIEFMRTENPATDNGRVGAHLWLNKNRKRFPKLPADILMLDGFNHQLVVVIPSRRTVIVRLGATVDRSWDTEFFVNDVLESLPN